MRLGRPPFPRRQLRCARGLRACTGLTLVELLCAMALAAVVLAVGVTLLVLTFRQQNYVAARNLAKDTAQTGLEQLEQDLRDAVSEPAISTSGDTTTLAFSDPVPGAGGSLSEPVTWSCSASITAPGSCTRAVGSGPGAHSSVEIDGLESFSVTPYGASGSVLALPTSASSPVSAVGLALAVQESSYALTAARGSDSTPLPGSRTLDLSGLADLRNES